jgi:L-cystine uptake protein TcyP (sodium:dicarboxylate symporter family)
VEAPYFQDTMLGVHLLLVAGTGLNPLRYFRKIFPVLAFAFTSRTSAGAIWGAPRSTSAGRTPPAP